MKQENILTHKVCEILIFNSGIQIESTKSVKNNESVHSKITKVNQNCKEEIKNYDIISGNNFTLGLKAKFSSNQSSNKNYVKRSKDQAKYSVIIKELIN